MSRKHLSLSPALNDYLSAVSLREPEVLRRLREETATHALANMQIAPEQGQFMALLARLVGAKNVLEIGVFTGYSSLVVALALPDDGRLVACDVSEEYTTVARRYWQEAGVAHKIDLRIAPALDTLDALLADAQAGTFDFAFIDADKPSYDAYYERTLHLLRPGGLVVFDNMLWGGRVADPKEEAPQARALHALNQKLQADDRIHLSLLPIADGVTLALKR